MGRVKYSNLSGEESVAIILSASDADVVSAATRVSALGNFFGTAAAAAPSSSWLARARAQLTRYSPCFKRCEKVLLYLLVLTLVFMAGIKLERELAKKQASGSKSTTTAPADATKHDDDESCVPKDFYTDFGRLEALTRLQLEEPSGQAVASALFPDCTLNEKKNYHLKHGSFFHIEAQCTTAHSSSSSYNSPTPFWRMESITTSGGGNRSAEVGGAPFHLIIRKQHLCLATATTSDPLFLTTDFCRADSREQQFILTVESVSLEHLRVYFALRCEVHKDVCLGLYDIFGMKFTMTECTEEANQLFYLHGVDYSKAFAKYKAVLAEKKADQVKQTVHH